MSRRNNVRPTRASVANGQMTEWSLVLLSIGVLLVLCCGCSTGVPVDTQVQSQPQLPAVATAYKNLADVPLTLPGVDYAAFAAELPDAELFEDFESGWQEVTAVPVPNVTRLRFISQVAPRIRVGMYLVASRLPDNTTTDEMTAAFEATYTSYYDDITVLMGGTDQIGEDLLAEMVAR